jgi:hypothetical protein
MTTPVFTEAWFNPLANPAVVPAGAPGTAGPGDAEAWVMDGGYPAVTGLADPGLVPPSVFRVHDPAAPAETVLVTDTTVEPVWQVIRAAEGPVLAHAPGFEVRSVLTPAGFGALAAGVLSGNGIVVPGVGRTFMTGTAPTDPPSRIPLVAASLTVPAGEAIPGSAYEVTAWGSFHTNGFANQRFQISLDWGVPILSHTFTEPTALPPANLSRWRIHATICVYDGGFAAVDLLFHLATSATSEVFVSAFAMAGTATLVTATPQVLQARVGLPDNGGGQRLYLIGGRAWRSA